MLPEGKSRAVQSSHLGCEGVTVVNEECLVVGTSGVVSQKTGQHLAVLWSEVLGCNLQISKELGKWDTLQCPADVQLRFEALRLPDFGHQPEDGQ